MQPTAVLPSARILLAEEQAASRDLVVLVLGKLDYQIDVVGSARDALTRLNSLRPALLLVSATLPDLSGPELVRAIGRRASPDPAPIVVIGPDGGEPPRSDYLLAGAFDYLARPIDIERLLRVVERSVRRRAPTNDGATRRPTSPGPRPFAWLHRWRPAAGGRVAGVVLVERRRLCRPDGPSLTRRSAMERLRACSQGGEREPWRPARGRARARRGALDAGSRSAGSDPARHRPGARVRSSLADVTRLTLRRGDKSLDPCAHLACLSERAGCAENGCSDDSAASHSAGPGHRGNERKCAGSSSQV